ncbi:S9 family peptidase [Amycolatopsis sp. NPDC054798]
MSESGRVLFGSAMLPSATDAANDNELRRIRNDSGVSAILHEEFPIRHLDHDLGPDRTRLLLVDLANGEDVPEPRDLTGHVGRALGGRCGWDITADGDTVVTVWAVAEEGGSQRCTLVAIDVRTGIRRTLADHIDYEYDSPRISPDGSQVAVLVQERNNPEEPGRHWLGIVPIFGGEIRPLTVDWDRRPRFARWMPDGTELVTDADDHGRAPLFRVNAKTGRIARLTSDDAGYTDFWIAPDGQWVYAIRSAIDSPPRPVRIALDGSSTIEFLPGPADTLGMVVDVPGRIEEVATTAEDGTWIRAWLALPDHCGEPKPAPLVVQIHGGPLASCTEWAWQRPVWQLVAAGYAVLLPDYALSTGYGLDFIRRGWGRFGESPYTDIMRLTDAAQARSDIDGDRAAVIGGSFGGFLANWIAGHTDRFSAIVAHASDWHWPQLNGTTDIPHVWNRLMTPRAAETYSPHLFADAVATPILITHGARDYRVPISEALRMWWDLSTRSGPSGTESMHKFLYFPDEGHLIEAPGNLKLWINTVLGFLDHHVLSKPWRPHASLG